MALIDTKRTADVWADTPVYCLELSMDAYRRFARAIQQAEN